jgi:hypothetical protein
LEALEELERRREQQREDRRAMWMVLRPFVWGLSLFAAFVAGGVAGTWWPLW